MINIKNPKLENLVDEILKRTKYSNSAEYLEARIRSDYEQVMKNKKLP
jgi:hypothetical protein